MSEAEATCEKCGGQNPSWFVDSRLWNATVADRGVVWCPSCFVGAFEAAGHGDVSWELRIDPGTAHHVTKGLRQQMSTRPDGAHRLAVDVPCPSCGASTGEFCKARDRTSGASYVAHRMHGPRLAILRGWESA